jgi:hypothetical protein
VEEPWTTPVSDDDLCKALCIAASVKPGTASGDIAVPGSKSISNRVLLLVTLSYTFVILLSYLYKTCTIFLRHNKSGFCATKHTTDFC